jgi:putative addiction module killer protein
MLPSGGFEVREYLDVSGRSPFGLWFDSLQGPAAAKVAVAVTRMKQGNLSNAKAVGHGVVEFKINYGPGYRIYFGRDGARLVILLGGGTKKRQSSDIANAVALWQQYKMRKG